jgi:tetratricopeptide (TPR) repeat protein/Zn-dependent membrane protease YugP
MLIELVSLLPLLAMLIGLSAARRLQSNWRQTFSRYAGERAACGMAGHAVARKLLDDLGIGQVAVVKCRGFSRYRPWRRQVCLGGPAFDDTSLPSVVVAAHEVAHAQQFAVDCPPARVWRLVRPLQWLSIVGVLAIVAVDLTGLLSISSGYFALWPISVVFLVMIVDLLWLEYDATRRAKVLIREAGLLAPGEQQPFDLLSNCGFRIHLWRMSGVVVAGVLVGVTQLLNNADWLYDTAAVRNTPPIEAPHVVSPPPRAPVQPQEVINVDLDVTAMLLWPAAIFALFAVLPVSRRIRTRIAGKRCAAARELQNQGALDAAIVEYNKAVRLDRKQVAAFAGRGTAQLLAGRLDGALADLETANRLAPGVAGLIVARGAVHVSRGDFERAMADFNEAVRLVPGGVQALVARGNLWLLRGDLERAAADYDQALANNPNDVAALRARCQVRLARNDFDGAMADIEQALARGGDQADSYNLRGRIWTARKDFDRAWADFETAIELAPNRADFHRDRGLAWLSQGDFECAIADTSHAIQLSPSDAVAFNNRGAALQKSGRYAEAIADLREAIRLSPSFPNPYKHLAWLQSTCPAAEFRNGVEAVTNATRALELTHWKSVDWFATLAAAHAEARNFVEARRWQTKCVDESPSDVKAELRARLELYEAEMPFREQCDSGLSQKTNPVLPLTPSSLSATNTGFWQTQS